MASRLRQNQFHVHLSDDEQRQLYALAERENMTASDWVRARIRYEAKRAGEKPKLLRPAKKGGKR